MKTIKQKIERVGEKTKIETYLLKEDLLKLIDEYCTNDNRFIYWEEVRIALIERIGGL